MSNEIGRLLAQLKTDTTEKNTFVLTDHPSSYTLYHETVSRVEKAYESLLDHLRKEPHRFADDLLNECALLSDFRYVLNDYYPPGQIDERQEQLISFADLRRLAKEEIKRRSRLIAPFCDNVSSDN